MQLRTPRTSFVSLCLASILIVAGSTAAAEDPQPGLFTLPAAGGEPTFITDGGASKTGSPAWSPDGKLIAYDLFGPGSFKAATVEVIKSDGTEKQSLGLGAMPSWSPDGKRLAFHTYGPWAIAVVNRDGSGRKQVINHWGNPIWMQDENKILSIKRGGIAIFDLPTGKENLILDAKWKVKYGISVSPDNRFLAFRNNTQKLHIAKLSNMSITDDDVHVRVPTGRALFSSWSPDGKRLAIEWKAPGEKFAQIYLLDADGNAKPKRLEGQDPSINNQGPAWSPDGKTIAYCASQW